MINLLQAYPVSEILIFVVLLALAIKGVITFIDWVNERLKKAFNKKTEKIDEKKEVEKKLNQNEELLLSLQQQQVNTDSGMKQLAAKIDMLIASDMDAIKAFITEKHHYYCYQQKWIDTFSMQCIENRYGHYVDEGGNSFIKGFMDDLRALPKQDPKNFNDSN